MPPRSDAPEEGESDRPAAGDAAEDADLWPRVKELLADCLDVEPAARGPLLAAADARVRSRVEALLAASARAPAGLDDPGLGFAGEDPPDDDSCVRLRRVGPYRLGKVLGEGGMGLVYEAFQEQPERTVALKILRPSVVSERAIQRFQAEIEILGRLQHPGIASIFDAGVIEEEAEGAELAVPWFAMERVDGTPLNRFAGGRPLEQRLALFLDVCDAVHYAHQRGVIHRDLKPANLLVTRDEAAASAPPRVRVLDFGIARATEPGPFGARGVTIPGLALGTLPYMSPEQVGGDPAEIDVRTDVYALGVLLYELLAGRLPIDVRDDAPAVAGRRVREEQPPPPSAFDRTLDRDLDTIAMHALEKDRERRYASVSELAADVRRFRRHEPILARPPSLGYHLARFARRHRGLVSGLLVAALLLVLSVATIVVGLERTRVERDKATSVLELLRGMLRAASPYQEGVDVTVLSLLDQAVTGLGSDHPPEVEATLRRAIGETYAQLGRIAEAEAQLRQSVDLLRSAVGEASEETLDAEVELAVTVNGKSAASVAHEEDLEERCRASLGRDHRTTLRAGLAVALEKLSAGEGPAAEAKLVETLGAMERTLGPDDVTTLEALGAQAQVLAGSARVDEAIALRRVQIGRLSRVYGERHAETQVARGVLALLLDRQGLHTEAEKHHRSLYSDAARRFGIESVQAFSVEEALAQNLVQQQKLEEAEEILLEGVERARRLGVLPQRLNSLAVLYGAQGRREEAEEHARRAYESTLLRRGERAAMTMIAYDNWATCRLALGETEEAREMFERSVAAWREMLGEGHPDLTSPLIHLGNCLARLRRWGEAEPLYREAAELAREHLHEENILRVTAVSSLGICLATLGRFEDAEPLLEEARRDWALQPEPLACRVENALRSLAVVYDRTGRKDQADEVRRELDRIRASTRSPD